MQATRAVRGQKAHVRATPAARLVAIRAVSGRNVAAQRPFTSRKTLSVVNSQTTGTQSIIAGTQSVIAGTQQVAALLGKQASSANVTVLGAQGSVAIALVKSLLEGGAKVTAVCDFYEQAQATLAFVKKYELVSSSALANLKLVDAADGVPKRAKVLIVEGDEVAGKRVDERAVIAGIKAAADADASQVILVTSGAPAATGFSFFGGAKSAGPSKALSRTEQLLASVGVPAVVLRAAATAEESAKDVSVVAGPGAVSVDAAPITKDQLAGVLAGVLAQPVGPAGAPIVLEAAATGGAGEALGAVYTRQLVEARAKAPAAPAAPKQSPVALGTISMRKVLDTSDDKKEAPKAGAKKAEEKKEEKAAGTGLFGGLFGSGPTGTAQKKAEPAKPAASVSGTAKKVAAPAPVVARKPSPPPPAPVKRAAPPPPPPRRPEPVVKKVAPPPPPPVKKPEPVATVKRVAPPPPPPAKKPVAAKEEVEKPKSGGGIFGFFAIAPQAPSSAPAKEAPKASATVKKVVAPPPAPKRSPSPPPPAPKPAPVPVKKAAPPPPPPARKTVAAKEEVEVQKPKSGGFFSFFAVTPEAPSAPKEAPKAAAKPAPAPAKPAPAPVKPAPAPVKAAAPARPASLSSRGAKSPEPEEAKPKPSGMAALFGWGVAPRDITEAESSSRTVKKTSSAPAASSTVKRTVAAAAPARPASAGTQSSKPGTQSVKPGTQSVKPGTQKVGTQSTKPGTTSVSGTVRGTYKPVSGFSVEPKKK